MHMAKRRRVAPGPARIERRPDRNPLAVDEHRLTRRRGHDRRIHRRCPGPKRRRGEPRPGFRTIARAPHVECALHRRQHAVPAGSSHLSDRRRNRGRAWLLLSTTERVLPGAGRRIAATHRHEPRGSDRRDVGHPESRYPVLDEPRLRGARRGLSGQHRIRPCLSRASLPRMGRGRCRGLRGRGLAPGRHRPRRSGASRHPRRQRRGLHHARRPHLP